MPLPLILGIGAGIAAVSGVGTGINGGIKMKNADKTMKRAVEKRDEAVASFELQNSVTAREMDDLGKLELGICEQFQSFSDVLEMIQGRPEFKDLSHADVQIPQYDPEELKRVSVGAGVLIGGLGGAAVGTAGGFAAAGVTTSAVMALGTASTGTAIASLSGAAATNATLAAIGGGAIAAGGGGIALGTTILGVSTLGVGLLVGGTIFTITGSKLSKKSDEAYYQSLEIERQINEINAYLKDLKICAQRYSSLLERVKTIYDNRFADLRRIIIEDRKTEWSLFTEEEKLVTQNCILLVGLLYKMCKVQLVIKDPANPETNMINSDDINGCMSQVNKTIEDSIGGKEG